MAGKVSKNSRTSKPTQIIMPKREKKRKETRLIELTAKVKEEIKFDLSSYQGKEILNITEKYGKTYLVVNNN